VSVWVTPKTCLGKLNEDMIVDETMTIMFACGSLASMLRDATSNCCEYEMVLEEKQNS